MQYTIIKPHHIIIIQVQCTSFSGQKFHLNMLKFLNSFNNHTRILQLRDVSLFRGGGGGKRATNFLNKAPKKFWPSP